MRSVLSSRLQPTPSEWLETLDRTSPSVTPDMGEIEAGDRKSTRLNSSHLVISYAVFCLKKKTTNKSQMAGRRSDVLPVSWRDALVCAFGNHTTSVAPLC